MNLLFLRMAALRKKYIIALISFTIVLVLYLHPFAWLGVNITPILSRSTATVMPTASFRLGPLRSASHGTIDLEGRIPKIIHQTWNSTISLPETFRSWIESWLMQNEDWQYWLWTDADVQYFISSVYPQYLSLYNSYPRQGFRSDALRYFVLYEYGGVYADMDMECVKPLQTLLQAGHTCIMSQEPLEHVYLLSDYMEPPLVSNALMISTPRHQFMASVINSLHHTAGLYQWNDILHATGPQMLTDVYRAYINTVQHNEYNVKDTLVDSDQYNVRVTLANPATFHPSVDNSMVDHMQSKCQRGHRINEGDGVVKRLCDRLLVHNFGRSVDPVAMTVHHWTHTWAGRAVDPWGLIDMRTRFNATDLHSDKHIQLTSNLLRK